MRVSPVFGHFQDQPHRASTRTSRFTTGRFTAGKFSKSAFLWAAIPVLASCSGSFGPADPASEKPQSTDPAQPMESQENLCISRTADSTQYLRQLSFDLRGRSPSIDELTSASLANDVPDALIDQMLSSDEFLGQVRTWHRAMLWPNIDGFAVRGAGIVAWDPNPQMGWEGGWYSPDPALAADGSMLHPKGVVSMGDQSTPMNSVRGDSYPSGTRCDGNLAYPDPAPQGAPQPTYSVTGSDGVKRTYPYYDVNGVPLPYHDAIHCANACKKISGMPTIQDAFSLMNAPGPDANVHELDPAGFHCQSGYQRVINSCDWKFDASGSPYPQKLLASMFQREGYRSVKHYWSAGAPVRTCALEAQSREMSVTNYTCEGALLGYGGYGGGKHDVSCGCGPDGRYCTPAAPGYASLPSRALFRLRDALKEEPIQIILSVISREEDYYSIFKTRRSSVTGPLAYAYRNQKSALMGEGGFHLSQPAADSEIPNVPYEDANWHEYQRGPEHAGILTTPAYLLRFPTWRARVSQFYTMFLCSPFTPTAAPLPAPGDKCSLEPDLSKRCGCEACHSAIEPLGAYWGRWSERSPGYLDPGAYPESDTECRTCALNGGGCPARCASEYVTNLAGLGPAGRPYAGMLRGALFRSTDERARLDQGPAGLAMTAEMTGSLSKCTVNTAWNRLMGRGMTDSESAVLLPKMVSDFDSGGHNYKKLIRAIVTSDAYRRIQ